MEEGREFHSYPFSLWANQLEMFLPLQQAMGCLPISGQLMQFSCHMTACYNHQAVTTQPELSSRNLETCRSWWWQWAVCIPAGLCCTWFLFHSSQTPFFQGGRSEFGTFWPQEGHLSSLQRGQGQLIDGQMLALGFSLESLSSGSIAGSPKWEVVT